MDIEKYVKKVYGNIKVDKCQFTNKEISELKKTKELLIYLPSKISPSKLCKLFGIKTNINFKNESLINNIMIKENQWFIVSNSKTPELINKSGQEAKRIYENEGLYGMDLRRYLAFIGFYKYKFGKLPDKLYWTFLLSGNYDRSGISIVGFDKNNVLNHHGWMKNFKAKFCGSRYIIIAPRIEVTQETEKLVRAYRGKKSTKGQEASMDFEK